MKTLIGAVLVALSYGIDQKLIRVELEKTRMTDYDKSTPVNEVLTLASTEDQAFDDEQLLQLDS